MNRMSPIARRQRALYGGLGLFGSQATRAAGSTAQGAAAGAAGGAAVGGAAVGAGILSGAAAGSVVPIVGTAIGAIAGLIASGVFDRRDQEVGNFDQALAMWRANRLSVLNIANKYLVLAGLMDLNIHTNIPFYKKYGRMGEQRFVTDMMNAIYAAANGGFTIPGKGVVTIGASDTPYTIMSNVVQPWMDSWGYGPMADPNADMINLILLGMISDYVTHNEHTWLSRSGPYPFGNLPAFSLPAPPAAAPIQSTSAPPSAPTLATSSGSTTVPTAQAGQYITPGSPGPFTTPAGTFQFASNAWLKNGSPVGTPSDILAIGLNNAGQTLALFSNGGTLLWPSGGGWWTNLTPAGTYSGVNDPNWLTGGSATATQTTPGSTTVPIPAGFTLIGAINGLQAYQGADGNVYTWNGVMMSLASGMLMTSSGSTVQVVNGQIQSNAPISSAPQPGLTQPYSYGASTPSYSTPYYDTGGSISATPPTATVAGAATVTAPSNNLLWIGAAVVGVFLFLNKGKRHHAP